MAEIEGHLDGAGLRLALVVSRFNPAVTTGLLAGARAALAACGVADDEITVVHVPGALELPLVCRRVASGGAHDAVIALGAVVRGETDHYDFVCAQAVRGCAQVADDTGVPVLLGVLTCASLDQAVARSRDDRRNKGAEVARAAVELVSVLRSLDGGEGET